MKKPLLIFFPYFLLLVFSYSCKKNNEAVVAYESNPSSTNQFIKYIIRQGQHYTDNNDLKTIDYSELKFSVKFDSTAIYLNKEIANQEDVNKLYGFSDNNAQHQQFSARFGWNWARNALRLYAYVYNNNERDSKEITSIQIGSEYNCSIKISEGHYTFAVNNTTVEMPRSSTTAKAIGYKLYPYFGGDEPAPHDINIWIKER